METIKLFHFLVLNSKNTNSPRHALQPYETGLARKSFSFFCKRHTFHFHQQLYWFGYLEYVGYLRLLASSGSRPGMLLNTFQCIRQRVIWPKCQCTKKLYKPVLTCLISLSTFSIHCTNLCISVVFLPFLKQ